jgi:cobalt-zinc-cadmium efflux system membrane fusion protein
MSNSDLKKSKVMKAKHPTIIVRLICCAGLLAGCGKSTVHTGDAPALKVDGQKVIFPENSRQIDALAVTAAEKPVVAAARMTGRLVWNDDVTVRVFCPVSGRVSGIAAHHGQKASAGDVLATIASPEFGQAQAEARKAVSDLKLAERAVNRVKELEKHGAAAEKDLEAAEAEHARAASERDRAIATLAVYGGDMESTNRLFCLKAPIDGWIVEKSINPGQEVRGDQVGGDSRPLFVVSNPARLWVMLDASEADLATLNQGAEISLLSQTYPDRPFPARIDCISDFIDPNSRTIKVRGTVENPDRLLRAEMFVSADLPVPLQAGVNVPATAIFLKGDKRYAFIEVGKGVFERRAVQVEGEHDGVSRVTSGIESGQRVVTRGALLLDSILVESTVSEAVAPQS